MPLDSIALLATTIIYIFFYSSKDEKNEIIIRVIVWFVLFQDYIARFGHGSAKLARQAQSKEKVLAKMVASGLTEKVVTDKVRTVYNFLLCGVYMYIPNEYRI